MHLPVAKSAVSKSSVINKSNKTTIHPSNPDVTCFYKSKMWNCNKFSENSCKILDCVCGRYYCSDHLTDHLKKYRAPAAAAEVPPNPQPLTPAAAATPNLCCCPLPHVLQLLAAEKSQAELGEMVEELHNERTQATTAPLMTKPKPPTTKL